MLLFISSNFIEYFALRLCLEGGHWLFSQPALGEKIEDDGYRNNSACQAHPKPLCLCEMSKLPLTLTMWIQPWIGKVSL